MPKILSATLCAICLLVPPVQANPNCGPRDMIVTRLAERYGEQRQSIGLDNKNVMIEVFASGETGTWTITATMPSGMTCLLAAGKAYEALAEVAQDTDEDA